MTNHWQLPQHHYFTSNRNYCSVCVSAWNTINMSIEMPSFFNNISWVNIENTLYSFINHETNPHFFPPQKYTMAGTSQFVPSLNAITTNQDLQWLVQPSLMHPPGPSRSPVPPYPTVVGARPLGPTHSHSHFLRPGVIRASATTAAASTRRRNDEHVRMMVPKISQLI